MAARKTKTKTGTSKQAFVASLPRETTYDDAVKQARAAGVGAFSKSHWYVLRSGAKKARNGHAPKRAARGRRPAAAAPDVGTARRGLVSAVRVLGIEGCRSVLDVLEAVAAESLGVEVS